MSDVSLNAYGGYGAGGRVEFDMFSASPSGIEKNLEVGRKGQAVGEYLLFVACLLVGWLVACCSFLLFVVCCSLFVVFCVVILFCAVIFV